MQVVGGVRLGGKDGVQALAVERVEDAVVEHAGGVHDRPQGVLWGDLGDRLGEGFPVGDVAGEDLRLCARLLKLCLQLPGALRFFSAAAQQEQVAGAVGLGQVAGDQGAEAAGGAGDQDGALGV